MRVISNFVYPPPFTGPQALTPGSISATVGMYLIEINKKINKQWLKVRWLLKFSFIGHL